MADEIAKLTAECDAKQATVEKEKKVVLSCLVDGFFSLA
jgi:hypothetical protein